MREYECLYILTPQLDDEQIEPLTEKIRQVITDNSGEVLSVNLWGKRRLAYEINHVREGIYVQLRFNGEVVTPNELDRALRFSEHVMRHLIVRADELDPESTDTSPEQVPEHSARDEYVPRRSSRRWEQERQQSTEDANTPIEGDIPDDEEIGIDAEGTEDNDETQGIVEAANETDSVGPAIDGALEKELPVAEEAIAENISQDNVPEEIIEEAVSSEPVDEGNGEEPPA